MINNVYVYAEVSCDNPSCLETIRVRLGYLYVGQSGQYDSSETAIGKTLEHEYDWLVRDGKHYCSENCAGEEAAIRAAKGEE